MDPYKVLGLSRGASKADIKKAFKQLALECHPDRLASAPEHMQQQAAARFRAVKDAYELLTDGRRPATTASAATGGGYSSAAQQQQWQYDEMLRQQRYRRRTSTQTSAFADMLRYRLRNFTRGDAAFHVALFTITFGGMWALSGTGESLWKSANRGKLFEDMVATQQQRKQDKEQRQLLERQAEQEAQRQSPTSASTDTASAPAAE